MDLSNKVVLFGNWGAERPHALHAPLMGALHTPRDKFCKNFSQKFKIHWI